MTRFRATGAFRGSLTLALLACLLGGSGASAQSAGKKAATDAAALCGGVAAPKGSSATEAKVWRSLCAAGYADLSALDKAGCAAAGDLPWPPARRLSAEFVKTILFEPPWRDALNGASPHLRCAEIIGDLDLSHRRLERALLIEESRVAGDLSLLGATVEGVLSLRGSRIEGALDAEGLRAGSDMFLRGAVIEGPVRLRGARLDGALEAQAARFDAGVSLDQARIAGPVRLTAFRLVDGGADLADLTAESLDLRGAQMSGAAFVSLRGARLGALDFALEPTLKGWPAVRDFRALRSDGGAYLLAPPQRLIDWLVSGLPAIPASADQTALGALARSQERDAFRALAQALKSAGRSEDARGVELAERRRRLESGGLGGVQAALWRIWDWTSGFGRTPSRLLAWAIGLALLGAALAAVSPAQRGTPPGRLFRLSVANAFYPLLEGETRRELYGGGGGSAAAFAMHRALGFGLLALAAHAAALRAIS